MHIIINSFIFLCSYVTSIHFYTCIILNNRPSKHRKVLKHFVLHILFFPFFPFLKVGNPSLLNGFSLLAHVHTG